MPFFKTSICSISFTSQSSAPAISCRIPELSCFDSSSSSLSCSYVLISYTSLAGTTLAETVIFSLSIRAASQNALLKDFLPVSSRILVLSRSASRSRI